MYYLKNIFCISLFSLIFFGELYSQENLYDNVSWGGSYFSFNNKINTSNFISLETNYIEKSKDYQITTSFLYPIKQNITNYNYLLNLRAAKISSQTQILNSIGTRFTSGIDFSIGSLKDSIVLNKNFIQFGLGGSFTIEFSYKRVFAKLLLGHHFQLESNSYNLFSFHIGYAINGNWIIPD